MRVNISNHTITSIDFDNVDQVIDFIKKFNEQSYSQSISTPWIHSPIPNTTPNNPSSPWYTVTYSNKDQLEARLDSVDTICSNPNK